MNRFRCVGCGECCRNLGNEGKPPYPIPSALDDHLLLVRNPLLQIFDWEKDAFEPQYLDPACVAYNKVKDEVVVVFYTLNRTACPYVRDDNRCSIYLKRPIVCRAYPSLHTDLREIQIKGPPKRFRCLHDHMQQEYEFLVRLLNPFGRRNFKVYRRQCRIIFGEALKLQNLRIKYMRAVVGFLREESRKPHSDYTVGKSEFSRVSELIASGCCKNLAEIYPSFAGFFSSYL